MSSAMSFETVGTTYNCASRSHSAQGLRGVACGSAIKIPLPPRLWITDVEDDSSDDAASSRDDGVPSTEKHRVRSRYRHFKQRGAVPIGIFWDIENCQVPRGCSAIDVVAAIRAKFLTGRREADFVVVCDVRKETSYRLQELNDAQISLIHVCGTQKNAADEKLRQCMRRFGELHTAPAALLLISGDINFAADLSDFRHRKNMEVILVHKRNTSQALIACASSHYCYNELTAHLPRNPKSMSQTEEDEEEPTCEIEVTNLPLDQSAERVSRRLRRLADNCGGRITRLNATTAILRFSTPEFASRALKRMDGEDVFGRKIGTRYARNMYQQAPAYSSDEGYSTAATAPPPTKPVYAPPNHQLSASPVETSAVTSTVDASNANTANDWALALKQLPTPTPPPLDFCPPPAPRLRKIRGTHGSVNLDRSGCSSSNSGEERPRDASNSRAQSPWNCSGSFSEHSDSEESAELTVSNLPPYEPIVLQEMLTQLFGQFVGVVRVSVWAGAEGPLASVGVHSEWDARLAIARVHKRRLDSKWAGRRLELALGRPSPAPNLDVLRARLRALLRDHAGHALPLLRLRDAYASRHCCALTTSDLARVKDTVHVHDGFGRMVQLLDLSPVSSSEMEEAPWKCQVHAGLHTEAEDGSRILQPVFMEIAHLAKNVQMILETHGGILPLLSFVECYEAMFPPLVVDARHGVALELLLRSAPGVEIRDTPSRHLTYSQSHHHSHLSDSSRSSNERERPRTAPVLEPILALFERELIDLLRNAPRCCIPFSKLIPAFHHHFGRQCRVADYGFTKLPDLLSALNGTIVVMGSGSSRVITISASAQARRWTSDLVKLLKSQPGRCILLQDIPQLYQGVFGRPFSTVDYGVCTMGELMARVQSDQVIAAQDGSLSLPKRMPTLEEKARTVQFAKQAIELLCYTPNLRMEFSRFVPAYHAHFGRQLRVAHYGCVKLIDLFELIPEEVTIRCEPNRERTVRLTTKAAKAVIAQRLQIIAPVRFTAFPGQYAAHFGAAPQPEAVDAVSLEALIYAVGGCIEDGIVRPPGDCPRWASDQLAASAVLASDKSVARGSSKDYFASAFRRLRGSDPDISKLVAAGVVECSNSVVTLQPRWRAVWRLAGLLCERAPRPTVDLLHHYNLRYDPTHAADTGVDGMAEFLRSVPSVFFEEEGRWALRPGVHAPRLLPAMAPEDYSVLDTPPGQKGSRVFESPKTNIWCSPPASALPAPTALLSHDNKRRTRLAAHFDTS